MGERGDGAGIFIGAFDDAQASELRCDLFGEFLDDVWIDAEPLGCIIGGENDRGRGHQAAMAEGRGAHFQGSSSSSLVTG